MSTTQVFVAGFVVVWAACAIGLGLVMRRRGYSGFGWAVVGGVLGPIGILVGLLFHVTSSPRDRWTVAGLPAAGPVDVLVASDGSAEAQGAASAAVDVLRERIGRVTVAVVEPLDATAVDQERARSALEATRAVVAERASAAGVGAVPGAVVLRGRPADALRELAADGGYDVIVVGSHGRGASRAVLGRVASALLERSTVPLLVTGRAGVPQEDSPTMARRIPASPLQRSTTRSGRPSRGISMSTTASSRAQRESSR